MCGCGEPPSFIPSSLEKQNNYIIIKEAMNKQLTNPKLDMNRKYIYTHRLNSMLGIAVATLLTSGCFYLCSWWCHFSSLLSDHS